MRKTILLALLTLGLLAKSYAQQHQYWTKANESALSKNGKNVFEQQYKPNVYRVFSLDAVALQKVLQPAQSWEKVKAADADVIIAVPNSKGELERFKVVDAPVMEQALATKHPQIKTYAGKGIDEPNSTIRFSMTPLGFDAIILSSVRKTIYINTVDRENKTCIVFDRDGLAAGAAKFDCDMASVISSDIQSLKNNDISNADDAKLRSYRLALCVNGEYSVAALNGAGGTDAQKKAIVLSVLTINLTRANAIYERDFGIHMNFAANETNVIYLDAATDPFGSGSSGWNNQTQATCDGQIGNSNYDVGHFIAKVSNAGGNNGSAGCIGCVCKSSTKGRGFTAHVDVVGDPLVVDYWTHEMGHQFGANHTFTFTNESTTVQVEPGSGSTIMGYAGITGATDVQPHSDDYFQAVSILQVTDYIKSAAGGAVCAVVTNTGNNIPLVNAGPDYTVPKSTPFKLDGAATDADAGDALSFCWEQIDDFITGSNKYPSPLLTTGPVFRSFNYLAETSRTFPRISSILDGTNGWKWEALPSMARNLNFRLTARDNRPGGGSNNSDDMVITVSSATGPFSVTAPNSNIVWAPGSQQTVTWSVNGTNGAPVNCANVKISLSTDGGTTFPTVLFASTPNDGTQILTVPSVNSAQCRIKVEAIGNIFFDISNTNFTIDNVVVCDFPTGLTTTGITQTEATVNWTAVSGAVSYDLEYKDATAPAWLTAATGITATSYMLQFLDAGITYDWRVRTNCTGASSSYTAAQFITSTTCPGIYDLGNNNTLGKGVVIPLSTDVSGLISPSGDLDFYRITVLVPGTVTVSLTGLPANYALRLYSGSTVVASSNKSGTQNETISYNAAAGTYSIRVNGVSGANNATLCYTLRATAAGAPAFISSPSAEALQQTVQGIKLYPNPARDIINIQLDKALPNARLSVFDMYGRTLISRTITGTLQTVDIRNLSQGTYHVKVISASGNEQYNLRLIKQ